MSSVPGTPSSPLPPMQSEWLARILDGPIPGETRATCDDCVMCNDVAPGADAFNPKTKCCTYWPYLANFLVGQILADDDPAGATGRASVAARIASGVAVTPLGLGGPAVHDMLYRFGAKQGFGRSEALVCPHYIEASGQCGIWRHRNGVCATWFCKHDRGEAAWSFWRRVQELLTAVEKDLARGCLLELGIGEEALATLFPPQEPVAAVDAFDLGVADLEGRSDRRHHEALWGTWAGRETEFFRACARLVDGLDFEEILRRSGADTRLRVELVRSAWQRLRGHELPAKLRVGLLRVVGVASGSCRVTTYSGLDPLEMPRALFDVLHHFDGRPTEEARSAIQEAGGPPLTTGLVRKMVDFGVLVPADGARSSS